MITFEQLREANIRREASADGYRPCDNWTLSDWTNALAGEAGEACNITKHMSLMPHISEHIKLRDKLEKELADVVIYADLIALQLGKSLPDLVQAKFNETSEKIGSDVRL